MGLHDVEKTCKMKQEPLDLLVPVCISIFIWEETNKDIVQEVLSSQSPFSCVGFHKVSIYLTFEMI